MLTFAEWLQGADHIYILDRSNASTTALVKINMRPMRTLIIGPHKYECAEVIKFVLILATDTRIKEIHFFADTEGKIENYLRGLTIRACENSFCGDIGSPTEIIETDAPGIEWDSRGGRITIAQFKHRLAILEGPKLPMVTLVSVAH